MPTAAVAIPMRTSAPDLTRSAAPTLTGAVATSSEPLAPPPIRRGLQAGPSRVSTPYQTSGDSSEAGGPVPSASQPPSLPPGPPSSVSSGYTAYTATRAEDGRQRLESSGEALAAPTTPHRRQARAPGPRWSRSWRRTRCWRGRGDITRAADHAQRYRRATGGTGT
eukprot:scaffold32072_cov61-Phaeocystis_antarctica.AAC.6